MERFMKSRWWLSPVVGLAAQAALAQTAPVASPEQDERYGHEAQYDDGEEGEMFAPTAPPRLPREVRPRAPFPGAVWTTGHWYWEGGEWHFKKGAWIARMQGYQYVNGYWKQEPGGWYWMPGGWARPGSVEVEFPLEVTNEDLTVASAPPPPQAEMTPPAPAPNLTWAPGYWYWSGETWVWVNGTWLEAPQQNLVYVSPRWTRKGRNWVFVSGGWSLGGTARVVVPVYRHATVSVKFGHPNYFVHAWNRYPHVHRYTRYENHPRGGPDRWKHRRHRREWASDRK
jgi:hypothetical protein